MRPRLATKKGRVNKMTKTELKRQSVATLKRIAHDSGITVCRDFTKQDIFEAICDRLGDPRENKVGWTFLDQYR